jgi:hypothetical protein
VFFDVTLPTDRFSHVAYTYDGMIERLYLDGVEVATLSTSGYLASDTQSAFLIGSFVGIQDPLGFRGAIDEAAVWDVVRCPADIRKDATTSLVGRTDEPCPPETIAAHVEINPETLNLSSGGRYITAFIELPAGHVPSDIDVTTVRLNGTIPAMLKPVVIGDHDGNGVADLMVKFNRQELGSLPLGAIELKVSGSMIGGRSFAGSDMIRAINPSASESGAMTLRVTSPVGAIPVEFSIESPLREVHTVSVFDLQGRLVRRWSDVVVGQATATWDGFRSDGSLAGSGVYFVQVRAGDLARTSKVPIVR